MFTDIEGSTRLLKLLRDRYGEALDDHQGILREAFAEHGGHEIDTQGDSFFIAFRRAKDAVSAAIACQRRLEEHSWPDDAQLRVRMGIHTGEPAVGGERYVGLGVHRAARICAAGHGGQILVSQTTRELLRDDPIADVSLRDLGEHHLKDMDEAERLYQVVAPGLGPDFPALKTAESTPFEGREGELAEAAAEEMAKRWRRPRRGVLIAATFAAAVVGAILGVLLTQGGGSSASASVSANAVGVIDPKGAIAGEIPVGVAPGGVAAGLGAVWVSNTGENTVSRIDSATNDVRQTIPVGGGPEWNGGHTRCRVGRERTGRHGVSCRQPDEPGFTGDRRREWADGRDGRRRRRLGHELDRRNRHPHRSRFRPGDEDAPCGSRCVGYRGRLWTPLVVSPPSGKVIAIDPTSGRVVNEIGVGVEPAAIAVGTDAVWVANRADGTVSKIEPRTGAVIGTTTVGRGPTGIVAGPDAVWVANGGDGTLSEVDPATVKVLKSVPLGNPPRDVVRVPNGVYVTVGSNGSEHRGGNLQVATISEPDFIDPALAYSPITWSMLTLTNDGLVAFRKVGGVQGIQLVPDLAISLPILTEGGKAYTFQLRPGIHYSNGMLVQPADFRRAIERVLELGSPGALFYTGIVGADRCRKGKQCDLSRGIVTDREARTVTFKLTAADGDFLSKLALPFAFAVPASTPSHPAEMRPVPATGPYRIATYRKKTKVLRLVRNPGFREWSADAQPRGFPDAITISWPYDLADPSSRVRAVKRGHADVTTLGGPPAAEGGGRSARGPVPGPASLQYGLQHRSTSSSTPASRRSMT